MSEKGLFDFFDAAKTEELLNQRKRSDDHLNDHDIGTRLKSRRSSAYSLLEEKISPEELANAAPITATDQAWFDQLPERIRPLFLRVRFTRVMRKIANAWIDINATKETFDELLLVERESRAGFPPAALQELYALRDYYFDELYPNKQGRSFTP